MDIQMTDTTKANEYIFVMEKVHLNLPTVNGSRNRVGRRTDEDIFTCVDIRIIRTASFMCSAIIMSIFTQEDARVQQERRLTWERLGINMKIHQLAPEHSYVRSRTTCFPGNDRHNKTETLVRTKGLHEDLK